MDNSNEVAFDKELRSTIEHYSNDGLLSAGEIIAVLEVVKHSTLHAAENAAADTKGDNFTSTNTQKPSASQIAAEMFQYAEKCEGYDMFAVSEKVREWARQLRLL